MDGTSVYNWRLSVVLFPPTPNGWGWGGGRLTDCLGNPRKIWRLLAHAVSHSWFLTDLFQQGDWALWIQSASWYTWWRSWLVIIKWKDFYLFIYLFGRPRLGQSLGVSSFACRVLIATLSEDKPFVNCYLITHLALQWLGTGVFTDSDYLWEGTGMDLDEKSGNLGDSWLVQILMRVPCLTHLFQKLIKNQRTLNSRCVYFDVNELKIIFLFSVGELRSTRGSESQTLPCSWP